MTPVQPARLAALLLAGAAAACSAAAALPNYHGCATPLARSFPYCNTDLSHADRVEALLGLLTLEEKVGLISPDPGLGSTCFAHIHGIPRVGLPEYGWLVEVNTGVASSCLGPEQCATTFSGPTGLGASFNRDLWKAKGDVLSTEMRAFSNANWYRGDTTYPGHPGGPTQAHAYIGTSAFGPNLNMIRDPRYGRNSELPSEDPFLTGSLGSAMVAAMQTPDASGHPRVHAYLKHFDAYSTETNRMHSDFNITAFDFWDTYLPQYKMAFTEANASGAMCSYTAINGVPSCANSWLLNDVLRKEWMRPDAYVTTDCGAVRNTMGPPLNLATKEEAAAAIINGGTDLEMGTSLWNSSMLSAVAKGLVKPSTVTTAARRGLLARMTQGDFDPVRAKAGVPGPVVGWASIGKDAVNSTAHQQAAYAAALQSMVLLKNTGAPSTLPLRQGASIAVVGPGALAQKGLVGPYFGDCICYAPHEVRANYTYECIPTIGSQIAAANAGGKTSVVPGVAVSGTDTSGVEAALAAVDGADVAVLVIGFDHTLEHEGFDADNNSLPDLQMNFALEVLAREKPTVIVLLGNDGTQVEGLVGGAGALVRAFYPATHGARALASLLFGTANRWGKLPVTMYPKDYLSQLPAMGEHTGTAYAMDHGPGRSYRYYKGEPTFKFGQGLSLTTFSFTCAPCAGAGGLARARAQARGTDGQGGGDGGGGGDLCAKCTVTNTGHVAGDEVVQVYHAVGDDVRAKASKLHPVPLKQLVGFERVNGLAPGASQDVQIALGQAAALSLTAADGSRVQYAGRHNLIFSTGVPGVPDVALALACTAPTGGAVSCTWH